MNLENIIVLEDSSKAKFGGGQKVTLKVIEYLNVKYNVVVADCSDSSLFSLELKKRDIDHFKLLCIGSVNNSKIQHIFELLLSLVFTVYNIIFIYKYCKLHGYTRENTLLYATTKKALILSYIMHKLFRYQFIYHAHLVERGYILKFIRYILYSAKEIVCVSEVVADQLKGLKTQIIYNPINQNTQIKAKNLDKAKVTIATISSLNHIKGIEYFMQSYQFLNLNYEVEYQIYGEGEYKRELQKYENKNITLKGYVNDIITLLKNEVDILVVPSIIPESFGMVILEAFSCGVPVISTGMGMQKILIEKSKAGRTVQLKNAKEIADAINSILENREEYTFYSKNAIIFAKKFSVTRFNEKIEKVFESCDITNK